MGVSDKDRQAFAELDELIREQGPETRNNARSGLPRGYPLRDHHRTSIERMAALMRADGEARKRRQGRKT